MVNRTDREDRRARAARIQAEQRKAERRRSLLLIGPAVLVALVMIGSAVFVVIGQQREDAEVAAAAKAPIDGVKSFKKLSRNHVDTPIQYEQSPAAGGDHASVWTNCGVYSNDLDEQQTVHSLEHGAVWVTHSPQLDAEQVDELGALGSANSYVLVSPYQGQQGPITATAWGKQLSVDSADDPRLAAFVKKYQQGPQTPEPGAACTGGVDGI